MERDLTDIIITLLPEELTFINSMSEIIFIVVLVVMAVINRVITNKLIDKDKDESAHSKDLKYLAAKDEDLGQAVAILANVMVMSFLSSTSMDVDVKKKIAGMSKELEKLLDYSFEKFTKDLIDKIADFRPGEKLIQKKEALIEGAKALDEKTAGIKEDVGSLVDKINSVE